MTNKILTEREKEILCLSCFTLEEISKKLYITPYTVRNHRNNINAKLAQSLPSTAERRPLMATVLITALDLGVITLDEIERRQK